MGISYRAETLRICVRKVPTQGSQGHFGANLFRGHADYRAEVHCTLDSNESPVCRGADEVSNAEASQTCNTKPMNTTKKLIVLSLLLALAGGATWSARAEQETPPPTPAPTPATPETPAPTTPETPAPATPETPTTKKATKPVEQQLNGRVVAVDKAAKTITLQVNNQTYVLQTADATKFAKAGKTKTLDDLIVGDEVTVTVALKENASGRVEIVVVSVDLPEATEAQGGQGNGYGGIPPFVNLPNPANVGGPVRSPSN